MPSIEHTSASICPRFPSEIVPRSVTSLRPPRGAARGRRLVVVELHPALAGNEDGGAPGVGDARAGTAGERAGHVGAGVERQGTAGEHLDRSVLAGREVAAEVAQRRVEGRAIGRRHEPRSALSGRRRAGGAPRRRRWRHRPGRPGRGPSSFGFASRSAFARMGGTKGSDPVWVDARVGDHAARWIALAWVVPAHLPRTPRARRCRRRRPDRAGPRWRPSAAGSHSDCSPRSAGN